MIKVVPYPTFVFIEIVPPCFSIILLQLTSPNPVPTCLVVNNGSNIFGKRTSGIPGPVSSTSITTNPLF